jgi:hypothetical protein
MNQILGCKASFADYYRKQRMKQLKLTLQPPNNMVTYNNNNNNISTDLNPVCRAN